MSHSAAVDAVNDTPNTHHCSVPDVPLSATRRARLVMTRLASAPPAPGSARRPLLSALPASPRRSFTPSTARRAARPARSAPSAARRRPSSTRPPRASRTVPATASASSTAARCASRAAFCCAVVTTWKRGARSARSRLRSVAAIRAGRAPERTTLRVSGTRETTKNGWRAPAWGRPPYGAMRSGRKATKPPTPTAKPLFTALSSRPWARRGVSAGQPVRPRTRLHDRAGGKGGLDLPPHALTTTRLARSLCVEGHLAQRRGHVLHVQRVATARRRGGRQRCPAVGRLRVAGGGELGAQECHVGFEAHVRLHKLGHAGRPWKHCRREDLALEPGQAGRGAPVEDGHGVQRCQDRRGGWPVRHRAGEGDRGAAPVLCGCCGGLGSAS